MKSMENRILNKGFKGLYVIRIKWNGFLFE